MAGSLKKARSFSFLIHAGYLLMLVLLVATRNFALAFAGIRNNRLVRTIRLTRTPHLALDADAIHASTRAP